MIKLSELIPEIPIGEIEFEYQGLNGTEAERIFKLLEKYQIKVKQAVSLNFSQNLINTEIIENLRTEIVSSIPHYDKQKLLTFLSIVDKIIMYQLNSQEKRSPYDILYDKTNLSEEDFHQSLYSHLKQTNFHHHFDSEKKGFADNGRIDIVYDDGKLIFPIEVKKSKRIELDNEIILKNYIGQAQTYSYPYHQLGIFVLFHIQNEEVRKRPMNNIRNLIHLYHLPPAYEKLDKYPDYVIGIIIPANRISPSKKSTYG